MAARRIDQVRGAIRLLPLSGSLFLAGFLAITGSPPFGPFISEFAILNGAFDARRFVVAGVFLFLLLLVFIGMGATVLQVVQGRPPAAGPAERLPRWLAHRRAHRRSSWCWFWFSACISRSR